MDGQALFTLAVLGLMIAGLIKELFPPDVMVCGALTLLLLGGILTPAEAFQGFSNPAMITVGALFIVARAMAKTGAVERMTQSVFGQVSGLRPALLRLTGLTAILSAFLNNTPIVAMFIAMVNGFCKRRGFSPSQLLIPLSYGAILGGVCTLIGTSTNLLISGLLDERGLGALGMFELAPIGLPVALVGILYLYFVGPILLPKYQDHIEEIQSNQRDYFVQMRVMARSKLVGKSISDAGLRQLPGLFLGKILRGDRAIEGVGPEMVLHADDRLIFVGGVESIRDLQYLEGLEADRLHGEAADPRENLAQLRLIEVVVSPQAPVVGLPIREANFRARYQSTVVAIHRHGSRMPGRVGDIALKAGDTLLLQGPESMAAQFAELPDFILSNQVEASQPMLYPRAWLPALLLLFIVVSSALEWVPVVVSALVAAILCGASGILNQGEARESVDVSVLMVIGASFGLATAMEKTGSAALLADSLVSLGAGWGVFGALSAIFLATMILTETISNNAAAALMFPVALASAAQLGVDMRAFAVAVTVAASLSFATPLGYQTNLMVYGPGNYRFIDFMKIGIPMQALVSLTALGSIYYFLL